LGHLLRVCHVEGQWKDRVSESLFKGLLNNKVYNSVLRVWPLRPWRDSVVPIGVDLVAANL
jgi:hypothetical protein